MLNVLTFDVEDYFQVEAFKGAIRFSDWEKYPCRVVRNNRRILQLLREHQTQATFFILGWIAERYPEVVQEIAAAGHEVATHGYSHELIYRQTPDEFTIDLERSLTAIERALGNSSLSATVIGYRAPTFSMTEKSLWALDILQRYGIRYDSSIFPIATHDHYGISHAGRFANQIDKNLWEFPLSTIQIGKRNLPVAGGGYFRLLPIALTRQAIRCINAENQPAVIYLHPWEFDPEQPRISNISLRSRFRHYLNLDKTETRLRMLLEEFQFAPMRQVFSAHLAHTNLETLNELAV